MTDYETRRSTEPVSGWAVGGVYFAGILMIVIGVFEAITGLAAIIENEFFVVARNYTFELDVTAWGWIHLLLGIVVALAGFLRLLWENVGQGRRDHTRHSCGRGELLLHPVLPVLVAPHHRALHLGHLVVDASARDEGLTGSWREHT